MRNLPIALFLWGCLLLLPAWGSAAQPELSAQTIVKEGNTLVTISNPRIALTFDPARGGRCVECTLRDSGEQLIGRDAVSGMFIDHWAKYTWPSGLMWLPYEYRIVKDGEKRIGIQLWITVPATGGGKGSDTVASSLKQPTTKDLVGLVVKKTIWLHAEHDVILVNQAIENPTTESRSVAPYIQHNLNMGGARFYNNWYMPSGQGVVVHIQPDKEGGRNIGPDWVLDPTAGWMAVRHRQSNRGMVFTFDYNYIQRIYTCGMTAEWFYDTVPLGPGKTFKYDYAITPVKDFADFVHASSHVVADLRPDEDGGTVRVAHDIAATTRPLRDVTAQFTVIGWKSKKIIAEKTINIGRVGFEKVRNTFTFTPSALADGVVIKALVRGADFTDRYEYYYAGDQNEYERRYNPFSTKGQALAGTRGDAYLVTPPRKKKAFDKPDFRRIPIAGVEEPVRCLVVFGLFTHVLNIDDALAGWRQVNYTWANCPPNAVEWFPGTYEELFAYNTVVLSDVNYRALGDIGFEMLCDYVEQGGKLLVIGGPYALGNGEFEDTRFLEVLPVELSGPFDLKWAGEGKSWTLDAATAKHRVLTGISFAQDPRVFWRHAVTPKPGAEVVLTAGGKPLLVLGKYGKGRVAVLTCSPTGVGEHGETPWWEWDGWSPLMKNILSWLNAA